MLKSLFLGLLPLALLLACASHNSARMEAWEKKLDPHLRAALQQEAAQIQSTHTLQVLLKSSAPLSIQQKKQLAELGVRLQTEAGTISTATLPAEVVTEVAKLDYVIYLELSKERKLLSPQN